jgi:cytochrome c oxidase subunit 4
MEHEVEGTYKHVTPLRVYLLVGAALLFLTGVTITVSRIPLGPWNVVVALGIAGLKAWLVMLFFMHLYYDRKIYLLVFSTAIVVLTLFIVITGADTMRRGDIYPEEARPIHPEADMYQKAGADTTKQNAPPDTTQQKVAPDTLAAKKDSLR